ncbi:helix-turn-helix domain-containing protein [Achromobacter marplatensis]|uniref:helix-turn-helix domain-containing protein n=1 Tax=Achromobacter marplatensis TaxID=470868 RepID=UPI0028EF6355|nr:helix-turn-helix domain-containing protein [Achromobacter marplatensis]
MQNTKPMKTGKRRDGNKLVLDALGMAGPQTITELAAATKLTKSSVRDVLERLAHEGRSHKTKEIRVSVYGRAHVFALGQGEASDDVDEPILQVRERTRAIQETAKTVESLRAGFVPGMFDPFRVLRAQVGAA